MLDKKEQRINLDISMTDEIVCEKCGAKTFIEVFYLRKIPASVSPSGQVSIMPIPTFECSSCGFVNSEFTVQEAE